MSILTQTKRRRGRLAVSVALTFLLNPGLGTLLAAPPPKPPKTPNILFFIMDDVGIDQMLTFGYGGGTPPRTPNINAIAQAGVRFRNTWSMPECTPSRAMFFEGRYPLRTNILNVITDAVLANSQVSPDEVTTPKLLKSKRGYDSAMFGKFHLAGPDKNPFGNGGPHALGWDYFYGFIEGAPHPIDTTAGGVGAIDQTTGEGPYGCGFVNDATQGACYFADGRPCTDTLTGSTPGRTCMEAGGLFEPNASCQTSPPSNLNFTTLNAYYVSPLVINHEDGTVEEVAPTDPRARGYRTILEVNAARDWIQQRKPKTPWMATVSFSSAHAPYQQPPTALLPLASVDTNDFNCGNNATGTATGQFRVLSNQMIESLDAELGRLLVELGLATRKANGELDYHPEETNTMVVIIGDNGTYAPGVKAPFDPNHSKGTVYQTGVWVPLIVAGPLVNSPGREATAMVNIADLYALFGEIADIDVQKAVPKSHILDAVSMLPYLTNPAQNSLRTTNFTQTGQSLTPNGVQPPPCVVEVTDPPTCVQIFTSQGLCNFEGGKWYGPGGVAGSQGLPDCCAVKNGDYYPNGIKLLADSALAIRNDRFKLVQLENPNCSTTPPSDDTVTEFYEINEDKNVLTLKIDRPDGQLANNLLPQGLNPEQQANFNALSAELQTVLTSEPSCPGDGNLDMKVNGRDLVDWKFYSSLPLDDEGLNSSWSDFNLDGLTDAADKAIIRQNLGTNCLKQN